MNYTRSCPNCGVEKQYTNESSFLKAQSKGAVCRKCAAKAGGFLDRYANSSNCSGANNPFYGKKHTSETIEKFKQVDKSIYQTDEFRNKMSSVVAKGEECYFYKTGTCQALINKHGEARGMELFEEHKRRLSIANSGSSNPMYGKPSPQGSGNGWSGWFKGHFFRSLRELTYHVKHLSDKEWLGCETKEFAIQYRDYLGVPRTYRPDFLVENKLLVEIKPSRLHNTPLVKLKSEAAQALCSGKGWVYSLVDPGILSDGEIRLLYESGNLRFTDRYQSKFRERYLTDTVSEQTHRGCKDASESDEGSSG